MKLIELTSDKPHFRNIIFKPNGLNIILGKHDKNEGKSTYNGVGKSLTIYLIHFCLGSNVNKKFIEKLNDWTFFLKISINEEVFILRRSTKKSNEIFIDDTKYKIVEFHSFMLSKLFSIIEDVEKASFRSLISRFIRSKKEEYLRYDKFVYKEQDERSLLSNSILLGLNYELVEKKFTLREEFSKVEESKRSILNDEIFKSVYGDFSNSEIQINELKETIEKLNSDLINFEISDDYSKIQDETNELSSNLKILNNEISLKINKLNAIDKSIHLPSDMKIEKVINFINQIKVELKLNLELRINDILEFHQNITEGRQKRLLALKETLKEEINKSNDVVKTIKTKYDTNLKYLNNKGALEDYMSINQKVNDLSALLSKLETSVGLIDKYKSRLQEIKLTLATDDVYTQKYLLEERDGVLKEIMETFRNLIGQFYNERKGGVSISNNDGANKLRYNLDVRIQDDSSDGINEVKIFCFDLLLLKLQKNHFIKFIFHDSRLFSDMDSHQRFAALKSANNLGDEGFQYIMSLNQDTYDLLKSEQDNLEFNELIQDNIILELSGESPESRLLGIHIDLNYE
jgi:uncharacterized protein YydD (DUF2326 family)